MLNLVINSRDAMSSRAGRITITTGIADAPPDPALGLRDGRYISVTVADNGPGMPRDVLDHVFEPFYTTKAHGTGLGLPSVQRTAHTAGGFVRIESVLGSGTTVTLLLPEAAE